ncbi:MAG: alkaline phosphatase family protein [Candidatus Nanohaloarchaea archaeon]
MELLVLGVDGVDPEYLEKTIEERDVPGWERLKEKAFYTELPSTVPAVTIPAWVSMFSGLNPGELDAYHLSQADFDSWELELPSSEKFQGKFFWDHVPEKVGLHYVPGTSPAYEVNGWMREGFPSPDDFGFYPGLEEEFGELERENSHEYTTAKVKINAEYRNYETERRIADRFLEEEFDVFVSVIRMTDQVSHFAEKEEQVIDAYEKVDGEIEKYLDRAEKEDANLLVVSDHGFLHAEKKFNITRFLEEEGYLETTGHESLLYRIAEPLLDTPLKKYLKYVHDYFQSKTGKDLSGRPNDVLSAIEKSSLVLPQHFGLGKDAVLKIHTEEMPHGTVGEDEREKILEELEEKLCSLEVSGEKVVKEVWRGEELYGKDSMIAFRTTADYIVETAPESKLYSNTSTFTHDEDGVFFATGPDIDENVQEKMSIYDVAALIYALLEEPLPEMDGEVPEKLVGKTAREREELDIDV